MYCANTSELSAASVWSREVAQLIDHIRLPGFPQALASALGRMVHFDTMLLAVYREQDRPRVLHPLASDPRSAAMCRYLNEAYMLDPVFNAIRRQIRPGVQRLADIAPDSFEQSDYYRSCYREFGLIDEVVLFIYPEPGIAFTVSIGRRQELGSVTRAERLGLQALFPVLSALVKQFWLVQSGRYLNERKSGGALAQAMETFGCGILTAREQEVAGLVLQGFSSDAIAAQLHISSGTVKVHRKNMHARLNTSTQSELFSLFLDHLANQAPL
ncbi:helix-turn-helix transcriptional regulator [Marinobacterium aestuarii]|uniref:Helix-turn-helix transcriptional regulator n=1 Tax=Marinobacterium aestuarii TaxID=1821621 RepID=A0A1A9F330_9GAMM|nr:helix-turn-helix transcriptional regulator [Marinobacterium aestuarii]ANG64626.1 helix-turn-helix transcriptional regulator [Marinobacterium aestuarii]